LSTSLGVGEDSPRVVIRFHYDEVATHHHQVGQLRSSTPLKLGTLLYCVAVLTCGDGANRDNSIRVVTLNLRFLS
jgi:hypothetical protein